MKTKNKQAVIKNKRILIGLASGIVASVVLATSLITGINAIKNNENSDREYYKQTALESGNSSKKKPSHHNSNENNEMLDFYTMQYGSKTYLALKEEDLLKLIEQAMKEVDDEYIANGNRTVFNSKDSEYSQFTKYHILGLFFTESSLRLLEVKDDSKEIFNVDNYARFYGTDRAGVVYYGPGMMSEETVNYIVKTDRLQVNNFNNYEYIKIDGKQVKITYENLNPYDYVIQSGAKTQAEVEQALKECIMLNVKSIYIYLNRIVKDNVKAGTHDEELKKLESYSEFKNLTTEEKQIAFALIGYNNGPTITRSNMLSNKLFAKHTTGENAGQYVLNVAYASKVMNKANEYKSAYEIDLTC
ncbi:MAG: hypothetical protein IJ415_00715 [Clostridia bacterium]|nr:hypothetical protein [Clostridia bacterium]